MKRDVMGSRLGERIVVNGSAEESLLLRWLQTALETTGSRPALNCLDVVEGVVVAADGYRAHFAPLPAALVEQDGLVYLGKVPSGKFWTEAHKVVDTPAYKVQEIVQWAREQEAEVRIQKKFLLDAIAGMGDTVVIRLHRGRALEVVSPGVERYALVMPMTKTDDSKDGWEPWPEQKEEEV